MTDFHMVKGDGLFLWGTSLITWCAFALLTVLGVWAVGGTEFKDQLFGDIAIAVLCTGIVAGSVLDYFALKIRHSRIQGVNDRRNALQGDRRKMVPV